MTLARARSRACLAVALLAVSGTALAAPDEAAFRRSIGLRRAWQDLTREVAGPAHWTPDSRAFAYRKTVAGGFAFEAVDTRTMAKTPAFDPARLATALGRARHETLDPAPPVRGVRLRRHRDDDRVYTR